MSSKIQYQSPAPTVMAIVLFAVIYIARIGALPLEMPRLVFEGNPLVSVPFIEDMLEAFETNNPVWAAVIGALLVGVGAIRTMNISTNYNLFSQVTHLPAVLYLIPFATFSTPSEIIAPALAGVVMTFAIEGLFGGYNHVDGGTKIFRGCFHLGIIPIIYPSMAVLVLLLIGVVLLLDKGGRDVILIVGGAATPMAIYLYIYWLCGVGFSESWATMGEAFMAHRWHITHEWGVVVALIVMLFYAILAVVKIDDISITLVARTRITFAALTAIVASTAIFVPSFGAPQLCVAALPIAITLTAALYELPARASTISYLLVIVVMMLVRVLP